MMNPTIALSDATVGENCALCGKRTSPTLGLGLVDAATHEPVCRECGRRHAASLAALLELSQIARRVGRIGRHTLVPPMNALLDLARAAEHYNEAASTPGIRRRAGHHEPVAV